MGNGNSKLKSQIRELKTQLTSLTQSAQREKDALFNREKQIQQQLDKKIELLSAKDIQNKELYAQEFEKLKKANDKKLQRLEQQREQDRIKYENDLKQLQKKTIEITKKLEKDNLQSTTIHCINLINSNISLYKEKREKCMNIFNKYKDQLKEIKQEQNRLNKFFVQENKDKTLLNIVLIGITGHGKSSFGSRLLGDKSKECDGQISCIEKLCGDTENDHFKHNDNVDSETQNITKKIVRKVWKKDLSVTDTPGIFDTGGRDFNHSNSLVKFLKGCGGVNAFLLVKTRHPPRIDMAFKDSLRTLEMLLGRGFWKHVIMIITHTRGKDANKLKFQSYSQRFRETMLNDMNLQQHEAPLPFIGVDSFENYKEPIKQLIKIIPDKRFLCDELRSPLDEFRLKNKNVKIKFENMKSVLDEIKNTINIFKDELNLANTRLYEMDTDYIPKQVDVSELNESKDQWEIQIEDSYDNFDNLDAFDDFKTCDDENKEGIVHNEIIDWLIDNEEENVYFGTLDDDDDITVHLTDLSFKNPWTIELNKDSGNYVLLVETFKDLEDKGDDIQVTVKTIIYKRKDKQMETKTEHIVQNVMCAE
eukprot:327916_1